jgi:hypothetical protein
MSGKTENKNKSGDERSEERKAAFAGALFGILMAVLFPWYDWRERK